MSPGTSWEIGISCVRSIPARNTAAVDVTIADEANGKYLGIYALDGDTLRAGLNGDLGFSAQDRAENIRRLAEMATHLAKNGHIAIVAAVSPSREDRAAARRIAEDAFREIHVATPAEICESRDPKGHYAKARAGALSGFTGIGNDYQPPEAAELSLDTSSRSVSEATDEIERMLAKSGVLFDELVDLAANI